jgi:hypothetical protein
VDAKIKLTIRMADRARKGEIAAPSDVSVDEILSEAKRNWNLSNDYEYVVRCERLGARLVLDQTLKQAGIQSGDILLVEPLSDGG